MNKAQRGTPGFYTAESCDLAEFQDLTAQSVDPDTVSNAQAVTKNVPVYDMNALRDGLTNPATRSVLMAEWAQILRRGAGVFVLTGGLHRYGGHRRSDGQLQSDHCAGKGARTARVPITSRQRAAMIGYGIRCKSSAKQHLRHLCATSPARRWMPPAKRGWDQITR